MSDAQDHAVQGSAAIFITRANNPFKVVRGSFEFDLTSSSWKIFPLIALYDFALLSGINSSARHETSLVGQIFL